LKISKEEPLIIENADVVNYSPKEKICKFSGNVKLAYKNMELICDELIGFADNIQYAKKIECKGKVKWHEKKKNIKLNCAHLVYERDNNRIEADGKPELISIDKHGIISKISGDEFELFIDKKEAIAKRNIVFEKENTYGKADFAKYNYEKGEILFSGNPLIKEKRNEIKGETILVYLNEKKIKVDKNVSIKLFFPDISELK
jgi:lipopolysaccharide export system protein LptA